MMTTTYVPRRYWPSDTVLDDIAPPARPPATWLASRNAPADRLAVDTALLTVIIVNYNGVADTLACIASLERSIGLDLRIVVVDNASTQPIDALRALGNRITLLENPVNGGYSGGNNLGIAHALATGADLIWLLNNDTVVEPDAAARLFTFANRHRHEAAFFGSWITFLDPAYADRLWFAGGDYDWRTGKLRHRHRHALVSETPAPGAMRCHWITGCSILVHADTLRRRGLMDTDLFLYREEVEWQLRGNPRCPSAMVLTEPLVRHKVGASTGTSRSVMGCTFMNRNFLKLAGRYAGPAFPFWLARWVYEAVWRPVSQRDRAGLHAAWLGVRHLRTPGSDIVAALHRR